MAGKDSNIEVKVGLLIVVCLGLLLGFLFLLGDFRMAEAREVVVDFETSAALKEGAAVKVAGISAGRVEKIEFWGGEVDSKVERPVWVRVKLSLKPEIADTLRSDARFYITTVGLLGEKYVEVDPGREKQSLGDVIKEGVPPMRIEVMGANVNAFVERANKLLKDNEQAITDTVADIRALAKSARTLVEDGKTMLTDVNGQIKTIADKGLKVLDSADLALVEYTPGKGETGNVIKKAIDRGESVLRKVDDSIGDGAKIRAIVDDVNAITSKTRGVVDQLAPKAAGLVSRVDTLAEQATTLVTEARGQVDKIVSKVTGLLDDGKGMLKHLRDGHSTVGALIYDREMYDDVREMMKDLKRHPWKFLWKE